MIRVQNIAALWIKQVKDIIKNLPVLVLFIVYPCVAIVITQAMGEPVGMEGFFTSIFATMHSVFTPIVATSSILAEEKEKNTLRVLIMSNVTMKEYLFSIGGFILIATLISGSTFLVTLQPTLSSALSFLLSLGVGSIVSILLGMCIGLYAKNASAANGLAVPFGMVFAFMPMLASFNKGIEAVSRFTYGQQISYLMSGKSATLFGVIIITLNALAFVVLYTVLFKKSLSED